MTTTTAAVAGPAGAASVPRAAGFLDSLRSEWTKARTVPFTLWNLLAATVLGIGIGALISALAAHQYPKATALVRAQWDPTTTSGAGLSMAQLAIGVLGILIVTSEYSTGAIRSSLAAVPRRGRFLVAKAVVVLALSFAVTELIAFTAFFIGQALISGHAPTAALGQPHVLRALVGCGLYGALVGLLGLALGTLLRHAAGAITVLVALLFVLPGIAAALPASIEHTVEKFWPTQAGQQVTVVVRTAHTLPPWTGLGVLALFVAIVAAAALSVLIRRDT